MYGRKGSCAEAGAQTEVANLDGANPNAQLKFQAALQTELRECQEELVKMQMQAKAGTERDVQSHPAQLI